MIAWLMHTTLKVSFQCSYVDSGQIHDEVLLIIVMQCVVKVTAMCDIVNCLDVL